MEILLGLGVVLLFVLLLILWSQVAELGTEVRRQKRITGAQGVELKQLVLLVEEMRQTGSSPRPAVPAAVEAAIAEPGVPPAMAAVPPNPAAVIPAARQVAEEAVPEIAIASAVIGIAQRKPQGPSVVERLTRRVRGTDEWEALIGGRLLNRIGAVALILGMAFFFKYAVDQNWISQGVRVSVGVLVGAGLLFLAYHSHQRGYAVFGQGLVGAGQAVLYLSVYASFNFYHLIPQPVALTAMAGVTALAFAQAIYYDSPAVSLLACVGGYLTPFLLSSGSSAAGTVAYVFLLDGGVLAVLLRKPTWIVLEPIALCATYIIYFSWYVQSYDSGSLVTAAVAISLFWALFLAFEVYAILSSSDSLAWRRQIFSIVNGAAYYGGLFALVAPDHRGWMSILTIALGAVYVAILLGVRRRHQLSTEIAVRYTLMAVSLLVGATAIGLRGFPVVILWSLEALPLVWYGTRWKLWYVWRPALVIYALAAGLLFAIPGALASDHIGEFRPLLNPRALAFLVLAGALAASVVPFRRLGAKGSAVIEQSLQYGWILLGFILLAVETTDLFRRFAIGVSAETQTSLQFERSLAIASVWMAFSLVLGWFGWKRLVLSWLTSALASAGCAVVLGAVVGIAYQPIERFVPVFNVRVAVFAALIGGLAMHLRWLSQHGAAVPWGNYVRVAVQVVILVLGFELISAEINDYFLHRVGHPLPSMDTGAAFVELAILAAVWILYSLLPTWYGVQKRSMPLVSLGLSMAAAASGVAAIAGIVFQPSTQFALMLGVRPIILTILVAGLLTQLRWLRSSHVVWRWTGEIVVCLQAAIILLGFGLISAETRDAFAQSIAGAGGAAANNLRDLERLAFSLVWLAYAILVMVLGIWRRARWMRLGSMALFACVILKVFVYDLSFLGAVYRPISFAGLGVILLCVSFLYQRYHSILLDPS